jgi:hypothetical protein
MSRAEEFRGEIGDLRAVGRRVCEAEDGGEDEAGTGAGV